MTDTKAALDALNSIIAIQIPKTDELGQYAVNLVRQALTTPPEAQLVMDDEVREAIEFADKERREWKEKADNETHAMLREHGYRPIEKHYENLIRAATQPPQATDAQRRAALKDINDFMASGDETDWQDVFDIFARHKDTIRTALQSPAVPREVQKALATYFPFDHLEHEEQQSVFEFMEQIGLALMLDTEKGSAEEYEYGQYVWRLTPKALALLGGKEG